jgi:acyl-CoA dehydrogenase
LWQRVIVSELDELGLAALKARIERLATRGEDVSNFASVLKYWEMEHVCRRYELAMLLLGDRGLVWSGDLADEQDRESVRQSLFARANTIGGGTSEIMLNVIAKRVLRLPSS